MLKSASDYLSEARALLKGRWTRSAAYIFLYMLLSMIIAVIVFFVVMLFHLDFFSGLQDMPDVNHADVGYAILNHKELELVSIYGILYLLMAVFAAPLIMYLLPVKFTGIGRKQPLSSIHIRFMRAIGTTLLLWAAEILFVVVVMAVLLTNLMNFVELGSVALMVLLVCAVSTIQILLGTVYYYAISLLPLYVHDNPDESVFVLFVRCIRQMRGRKWKLFGVDFYTLWMNLIAIYIFFFFMIFIDLHSSVKGSTVSDYLMWGGGILMVIALVYMLYMLACNFVARALLYDDIVAECGGVQKQSEDDTMDSQPASTNALRMVAPSKQRVTQRGASVTLNAFDKQPDDSQRQQAREKAVAQESEDFLGYILSKNNQAQQIINNYNSNSDIGVLRYVLAVLFLTVLTASESLQLHAAKWTPNPKYLNEYYFARQWLAEHAGVDTSAINLRLRVERTTDNAVLFNDHDTRMFVLMARQSAWKRLACPVLAYSTENSFDCTPQTRIMFLAMSVRLNSIPPVYDPSAVASVPRCESKVEPLLGGCAWGQTAPYNSRCPMIGDTAHAAAGSLSVACAQLMRYHACPSGVEWGGMLDSYSGDNTDADKVALLLGEIGNSLQLQYGLDTTKADILLAKEVMVSKWGFSPRMTLLADADEADYLRLIRSELQEKRPVMAGNAVHSYIIDGCDGDYLHFNIGCNGQGNGWYNPLLGMARDERTGIEHRKVHFSRAIMAYLVTQIEPRKDALRKDLTVKYPGQLAELLGEEDILTVTHLKISGKLGSDDVRLLRRMAGAIDPEQPLQPIGSLQSLDLADAKWVNDKKWYLRQRLTGFVTLTQNVQVYQSGETGSDGLGNINVTNRLNLANPITDEQWAVYLHMVVAENGKRYVRDEQGYGYLAFVTKSKTVSPMMFMGCSSLQEIVLPKDIQLIEEKAFCNCHGLHGIDLPAGVKVVKADAFSYCASLKNITYHNKALKFMRPNFTQTPSTKVQYVK